MVWMPVGKSTNSVARRLRARRSPIGLVSGCDRILREGMQDVGEQQFLMLLLVMEADLEDAHDVRQLRALGGGDQALDRRIDMRAVGRDLLAVRPRDQAAPGPRVARARPRHSRS